MNENVHHLLDRQLAAWETARRSYDALAGVRVKELDVRGVPYKVQFNPARIVSSGAKVDARSIKERRCFLCAANRPAEQEGIPFLGHYELLVNPFPIFPAPPHRARDWPRAPAHRPTALPTCWSWPGS